MEDEKEGTALPEHRLSITGFEEVQTQSDIAALASQFASIREILSQTEMEETPAPFTAFFRPGETVAEIKSEALGADDLSPLIRRYDQESFQVIDAGTKLTLLAQKHGYLLLEETVSLVSPTSAGDRFALRFCFLPVRHGREALLDHYQTLCREHQERYPEVEVLPLLPGELEGIPAELAFESVPVRGVEPREGRDAEVNILVEKERENRSEETDEIDYHTFRNYIVAEKGTILAEKLLHDEGRVGIDICGEKIPVYEGVDKAFEAGEHVATEEVEGKILYRAEVDGLVQLTDTSVALSEVMIVEKDVDFRTGNVQFSGDVVIKGAVRSGFTVRNDGNLFVHGTIEPGSEIHCDGDVIVKGGALGEKTVIQVKGSCELAFAQGVRVYCEGDLSIQKSVLAGSLFAGGNLTVIGKGLKGESSSVIGGHCYAMERIEVRSAGSYSQETTLISGYNPFAEAALKDISAAIKIIEVQIAKTVDTIGFDIHDAEALKKVGWMTSARKQWLKKHLLQLKQLTSKREKLLEQEKIRRGGIFQKDINAMGITVRERLVPVVRVQFHGISRTINTEAKKVSFFLKDDEIVER